MYEIYGIKFVFSFIPGTILIHVYRTPMLIHLIIYYISEDIIRHDVMNCVCRDCDIHVIRKDKKWLR